MRKQTGYADLNSSAKPLNISRAKVFMCSARAAKFGVQPGMRLTEAQAHCGGLVWRECDEKLYMQAQHQLVNELVACSPRVSVYQSGIFLLDAAGFDRLGGESKLCRDVLRLASRCGYVEGRIGIADSAFAALVASRHKTRRWHVISPGKDRLFLEPLSIENLPISEDVREMLFELGVERMGELVKLSRAELTERFGPEGKRAYELACGIDDSQPSLPLPEQHFTASVEVGGPVESLNDTLFLFKSMLDRLSGELKQGALCAEELLVEFFNDNDKFDQRVIQLIKPTNGAKFLLDVIRLTLESKPLMREFTGLKVAVVRVCQEQWQQPRMEIDANSFSADIACDPMQNEGALLLLQRFRARVGEQSLVCPAANDDYFSGRSGVWLPVLRNKSDATELQAFADGDPISSVSSSQTIQPIAQNAQYVIDRVGMSGLTGSLVMRRIIPAEIVLARLDAQGMPLAITHRGKWHQVKQITSPERLSGHWWELPVRRSCYMAAIERSTENGPVIVSLIHDNVADKWMIEGVFD